jgi:hypothetical protein
MRSSGIFSHIGVAQVGNHKAAAPPIRHARHSGPASPARAQAHCAGHPRLRLVGPKGVDGRDKPGHDERHTSALPQRKTRGWCIFLRPKEGVGNAG